MNRAALQETVEAPGCFRYNACVEEDRILFIWPPFVVSRWYPLGIPSLVAALKDKGIGPVDVFDMNASYLRELQPLWSFYAILKRACSILRQKPMLEGLYGYLERKRPEVLDRLGQLGGRSLPWSLKSILDSLSEGAARDVKETVRRLLGPVVRRGGLSRIGISATYPEQLFFALLAAQSLKKAFGSSVSIVLGGAQVTKHIDTLSADPRISDVIDFLVVKDAEEALALLWQPASAPSYRDIPNLFFKDVSRPGVFVSPEKYFSLKPEDFFVPDFSGFAPDGYEDVMPLIVTKGCPWARCSFCSYSIMQDRHFSIASVEKTMGLIKGLVERYKVRELFFVDDALPAKFTEDLARALRSERLGVAWSANIVLDRAFQNPDFCRLLRESGSKTFNIGLETVVPRVCRLMNKHHQAMTEEGVVDVLRALKGAGIKVQLNIIFGFPTESREEACQTLNFLLKNIDLFDHAPVQPFCLEDHTMVADDPGRFGIAHIYKEDKNMGRRLGYRYDVREGMTQEEAARFTEEASRVIRDALEKKRRAQIT